MFSNTFAETDRCQRGGNPPGINTLPSSSPHRSHSRTSSSPLRACVICAVGIRVFALVVELSSYFLPLKPIFSLLPLSPSSSSAGPFSRPPSNCASSPFLRYPDDRGGHSKREATGGRHHFHMVMPFSPADSICQIAFLGHPVVPSSVGFFVEGRGAMYRLPWIRLTFFNVYFRREEGEGGISSRGP